MAKYSVISADSHFVEPPGMWAERLDNKFRDRAPHTVKGLQGREGEFFVCENISPLPVAAFFGAGVPSQELPEHNKKGFDQAPASVWDPAARIKDQDLDGVKAEVIYTSMGMPLYSLDDAEMRAACFQAYNDWAVEYCSYDPKRLIPLGLITLEDIGAAVQELQRVAKKGMRGAMIWADPPGERPYSHPDYDPFWAAAQDLNMPLSLHIGTGRRTKVDFFHQLALQASTIHHEVERSLAVFVLGGVLERFPKLTLISAENDVAWMAYFMWRLDFVQGRLGALSPMPLTMKPSEYIKRQVYATFINEPVFVHLLKQYGADNIMWSSDYPHTAAIWPRSQQFIEETFGGLSEDDRRKIVHDTAARVYGITD
ncbi:MAG TPA: amidohydrolase family protein [Candidatus Binatia bacterium]|nr:amidohydrolase family protein [Candidatus Binatia bacterium]